MDKNVYWANLCILIRKESALMEKAAEEWKEKTGNGYVMNYLGDTEEVQIHQKISEDVKRGKPGFDLIVSSRFDIFCSQAGIPAIKDKLHPIGGLLPVSAEVKHAGVEDSMGLYHPLTVLLHSIVCNTSILDGRKAPSSLEELLDPAWEGKVCIGNTALPSGQAILFAMWYLFGDEGLDICVKNWRQRSTPAAARHSLLKREFPIAVLPGVFSGPAPEDTMEVICPKEGMPAVPSYAAVAENDNWEDTVEFLKYSTASKEFQNFYRNMAIAVPANPDVPAPQGYNPQDPVLFPPWEWILKQDVEAFKEKILQVPS